MLTPGCIFDLGDADDEGAGGTGNPPLVCQPGDAECNGVEVWCNNAGGGGDGVDDSGDGGGSELNFWWAPCDDEKGTFEEVELECVMPDISGYCCTENGFACCQLDEAFSSCFCKQFSTNEENPDPAIGDIGPVCVGENHGGAANFDPLDDWQAGSPPYSDQDVTDEILAQCSQMCVAAGPPLFGEATALTPEICVDENWSGFQTRDGWVPADGPNCPVPDEFNGDDPDGSEVPWVLVGGPSSPVPLDCSLVGNCFDEFYPNVLAMIQRPSAGFIEAETSYAHYSGIADTGSGLEIDMSGSGTGVDDTEPMYGGAEYTASDCGDDVCPFFLANLSAYGTDTWEVRLDGPTSRYEKEVSNVQIDLMQATLGALNTNLDKVAFAPGALRLRIQMEIDSCPTCDDFGDGTHTRIIANDEYVFADYDDGEFEMSYEFGLQSGTGTLTLEVTAVGHPPTAGHDLGSTELCDSEDGLRLDAGHDTSTDPDNDIGDAYWMVDGVLVGETGVVPVGSHVVELEVHDTRGAASRTAAHTVYVATAGPCT